GSATVLADDPSLNLRWNELGLVREVIEQSALRQPIRIVIDSNNNIKPQHKMIGINSPIILVRRQADDNQWPSHVEQLIMVGQGKIDLAQLMALLAKREINSIWVEAGATLCGALLSANLVDKLVIYQAAKLMGGGNKGLFNLPSIDHMDKLIDLTIDDVRMIAKDIRICATPIKKE
ncbi:MAG: dihydrofolate reductase family protein, partial [Psychrobium sp.]|nr:dihydrofolate reductase family protein [Psychrobium sp.]